MGTTSWNKSTKESCAHCNKQVFSTNMERHLLGCQKHPDKLDTCPICGRQKLKSRMTCGHSCANKMLRSNDNHPNWKEESYRSTCFLVHRKECVVCGENNIVEVHHLDEDKENNKPENLIPLCPTHHQYWHSRYRPLVEQKIIDYITSWKLNISG